MGRKKTAESDTEATRGRIVDTAERLFREVGYSKTTVADIAKNLGMSPANVYRYFASKSLINEEICRRLIERIEAECNAAVSPGDAAKAQLSAYIGEYHRSIKRAIIKDRRLHEMVAVAMQENWPVVQRHCERVIETFRAVLEKGIAAGEFRDMDCFKTARTVHDALVVFLYPALVELMVIDAAEKGVDLDDELARLLDLLFLGLRA